MKVCSEYEIIPVALVLTRATLDPVYEILSRFRQRCYVDYEIIGIGAYEHCSALLENRSL